ncbi:Vacuolar protein sorting-associated protein 20 [Xylographa carneopallida]|nr:Vacuolar protein sorting-associated protein 20 [Xylographa carneopallida]
MGNTPSSHKISAQDRAILDMKNQRDKLHQYQKRITKLTDRETAIAKECLVRGQKSKALLALRRKKYQESLLAKTDLQLEQLQQLTSDVEFATVQKDVLYGLQQGTLVLNQIHAEMGGIDRVEKLLEESAEARAYEHEISEMLGGKMSNADEDDVEDELERLQKEVNGMKEPEVPSLPNAPNAELKSSDADVESVDAQRKARARARAEASRQPAEPIAA